MSKKVFKPAASRVLVRPVAKEEKTAGGILLPGAAKEKPVTGRVIAVGPGTVNSIGEIVPPTSKVGDEVLYGQYAGQMIVLNDDNLILLQEHEVLGTYETVEDTTSDATDNSH